MAIKKQLEFEDELIQLSQIPKELAVLPINDAVVFPLMMVPLLLNDPNLLRLADEALADQKIIGAFTQINPTDGKPSAEEIFDIGTAVHIQKMIRFPNGEMRLMGQGLTRIRIIEMTQDEPYMRARIEQIEEQDDDTDLLKAYIKTVTNSFSKVIDESESLPEELKIIINNIKEPGRIADVIAANMSIDLERKQSLLKEIDVLKRFKLLSDYLSDELEVVRLGKKLQSDVEEINRQGASLREKMSQKYRLAFPQLQ